MALRRKKHDLHRNRKRPIEHTGFYPYMMRYLEAGQVRGYSDQTMIRNESNIRRLAAWCELRGIDTPQEVTKPVLEHYQKHLYYYRKRTGQPLSFASQQQMLAAIKGFFRWLAQHNHILYNPASELQLPKPPRHLPRTILAPAQIDTVLNQADLSRPEGIRDRTIMELFYSCGVRRTELANLKHYDVDLARHIVAIHGGKGGKDRILPLSERLAHWITRYLNEVRDLLTSPLDEGRLFITDYGEPFNGGHLGRMVKKYLKQAGIEVTGSCHLFRHAMATHMLDHGADIRFIQAMLGHEDLTSTEIYTRVSVEKLRDIHRTTHPAARLRSKPTRNRVTEVEPED